MNAKPIVDRLLEAPDNDALDDVNNYLEPASFHQCVKDILEHAQFLKDQSEQAGALQSMRNETLLGKPKYSERNLNRAFLLLACEELNNEVPVEQAANKLKRLMHSIWS